MNTRTILSILVITGCVQEMPVLEPGRVFVADVVTTEYRVSNIPFVDYLEARGSDLHIRDGVEVWVGPQRAELVDVDLDGILVRLATPLPVGVYDLRVHAELDHMRVGALQVVETTSQDGGADGPDDAPGLDVPQDCNDVIDPRACGSDVGECRLGMQRCIAGAWEMCSGGMNAVAEVCDGLDNGRDDR
ncbi:MAG: hypothetical protein ACI9KE_001915 [Polyangiales bacterium]|jgi:hypothetical protein